MQVWQNKKGDRLIVDDVSKVKCSVYFGKRVKSGRYVVSAYRSKYQIWLKFDHMCAVRYWMAKFGYKQIEDLYNA